VPNLRNQVGSKTEGGPDKRGNRPCGFSSLRLRSFSVVGVFPSAIRETDFPDLIASKVEHLELDIVGDLKEQVARLPVQLGINDNLVLQLSV
jgi:hypothetical protein